MMTNPEVTPTALGELAARRHAIAKARAEAHQNLVEKLTKAVGLLNEAQLLLKSAAVDQRRYSNHSDCSDYANEVGKLISSDNGECGLYALLQHFKGTRHG